MIMPVFTVKNVDASIAFYEKLGFAKQMSFPDASGETSFAIIVLEENTIGLGKDEEHKHIAYAPGVQFMVYIPRDGQSIDDHLAQTVAQGVALHDALGSAYWGDRTYSVTDPDGYMITISQEHQLVDVERVAAVIRGDESASKTD